MLGGKINNPFKDMSASFHSELIISCANSRKNHRRIGRKLASFYTSQNDQIQELLKPLSTLSAEGEEEEAAMAFKVKLAVNLSLAANIALAALQLYAAISSLSLALFASCIDAGEWTTTGVRKRSISMLIILNF